MKKRPRKKPATGGRITPEQKEANRLRHLESNRRPGTMARVENANRKPPTPTQLSKAALGDDPHANHGNRGGLSIRIAQARRGAPILVRPAVEPTPPAFAPGETWPSAAECCWPTSDGRPWTFCRSRTAPDSRRGYCERHAAADRERSRADQAAPGSAAGAIARTDFALPSYKNHQEAAVRASRTAAAQIAQRGPRKRG